jgi:hypothetical protein
MTTDYEKIEADCLALLKENFIEYTVTHRGFGRDAANWEHDLWFVCLTGPNKGRFEFEYRTGMGHRVVPEAGKHWLKRELASRHSSWHASIHAKYAKPVPPKFHSVFKSIELDAYASIMSFSNWCSDYGYSNDSIQALTIYRLCEDHGAAAHRLFPPKVWTALCELVEDV